MGSTTVDAVSGLAGDWTSIVGGPSYYRSTTITSTGVDLGAPVSDILFYNKATGEARFARLQERGVGSIQLNPKCQTSFNLGPGWTNIVWASNGLLFYNQQRFALVTEQFDGRTYTFANEHAYFPNPYHGYTNVTATGNHVLFYQGGTGTGTIGWLDSTAGYRYELEYSGSGSFSPDWTTIVGRPALLRRRDDRQPRRSPRWLDRLSSIDRPRPEGRGRPADRRRVRRHARYRVRALDADRQLARHEAHRLLLRPLQRPGSHRLPHQ